MLREIELFARNSSCVKKLQESLRSYNIVPSSSQKLQAEAGRLLPGERVAKLSDCGRSVSCQMLKSPQSAPTFARKPRRPRMYPLPFPHRFRWMFG